YPARRFFELAHALECQAEAEIRKLVFWRQANRLLEVENRNIKSLFEKRNRTETDVDLRRVWIEVHSLHVRIFCSFEIAQLGKAVADQAVEIAFVVNGKLWLPEHVLDDFD